MSDLTPRSNKTDRVATSPTLTDRVLEQLRVAAVAVDRRANATRPQSARRPPAIHDPLAASVTRTPEQIRTLRSLRYVFHGLGASYRAYRRRTGALVSPDVRASAYRFRRELDLTSLVAVAAGLDELHILTW
jgi:hypothetical protein